MIGSAASTLGAGGTCRRHEGLGVGVIGATAVWMWLLVSDMHSRTPFSTPAFLGRGLLSIDARGEHVSALAGVFAFTIAHYAVWMAVGTLVIAVVGDVIG